MKFASKEKEMEYRNLKYILIRLCIPDNFMSLHVVSRISCGHVTARLIERQFSVQSGFVASCQRLNGRRVSVMCTLCIAYRAEPGEGECRKVCKLSCLLLVL